MDVKSNDDLVDKLVEAGFIQTPQIEKVFRAVDRGSYFSPLVKYYAYLDISFIEEKLYFCRPSHYSKVMEELNLRPGLSFLNLGSGSGYLNTMAGLILGTYGKNHGIELYSDLVEFANRKVDEFIHTSNALDEYDFCEPSFVVGNCFMLDSSCQRYDRVYCGASCPAEYELYVKNLVKIGGILIMPLKEEFLKITRTEECSWNTVSMLSSCYATLTVPPPFCDSSELIKLDDICPPKLIEICRFNIRGILRKNIDVEYPNLKNRERRAEAKHKSENSSAYEHEYSSPELNRNSPGPSRKHIDKDFSLVKYSELEPLRKTARIETESHTESRNIVSETDSSPEKENPDSKIVPLNREFTSVTIEPKNSFTAPEKSSSYYNQSAISDFKNVFKSLHTSSYPHSSETDENIRQMFPEKKSPTADDEDSSSSSTYQVPNILVERRATPIVGERITSRYSDSGKKVELKNKRAKTDYDNDTYTKHMVKKIADLPLPSFLLMYLNYGRDNM